MFLTCQFDLIRSYKSLVFHFFGLCHFPRICTMFWYSTLCDITRSQRVEDKIRILQLKCLLLWHKAIWIWLVIYSEYLCFYKQNYCLAWLVAKTQYLSSFPQNCISLWCRGPCVAQEQLIIRTRLPRLPAASRQCGRAPSHTGRGGRRGGVAQRGGGGTLLHPPALTIILRPGSTILASQRQPARWDEVEQREGQLRQVPVAAWSAEHVEWLWLPWSSRIRSRWVWLPVATWSVCLRVEWWKKTKHWVKTFTEQIGPLWFCGALRSLFQPWYWCAVLFAGFWTQ